MTAPGTGPVGGEELDQRPVPAYVITQGRAVPSRPVLRPETLLLTRAAARSPGAAAGGGSALGQGPGRAWPLTAAREQVAVLTLCRQMLSVAEVAAHLEFSISVVMVIASDLIDQDLLTFRAPARIDIQTLEEVLNGLRNL